MAIVATASGLQTVAHNLLSDVRISTIVQEQCYAESLAAKITTAQYNKELTDNCLGTEIVVLREPLGRSYEYCADGQTTNTAPAEPRQSVSFKINKVRYMKESLTDLERLTYCDATSYLNKQITNNRKDVEAVIDQQLLAAMVSQADCFNKGAAAGRYSRAYNLGAAGAAVPITAANILSIIGWIQRR